MATYYGTIVVIPLTNRNLLMPPLPKQPTEAELSAFVEERLPKWRKVCENTQADHVLLAHGAFTDSAEELLLLGAAIKYAARKGKNVLIAGNSNLAAWS